MAGLIASTSGPSPSTRFRPRSAVIRSLAAAITFLCGRSTEQRPLERAQIYRSVHRRRAPNARTERRPEESAAAYRSAHLCFCCDTERRFCARLDCWLPRRSVRPWASTTSPSGQSGSLASDDAGPAEDSVGGWCQEPPGGVVLRVTSRPRYGFGLLDRHRGGGLRHEGGDDRFLVALATQERRRLLVQVLVAPLLKSEER